MIAHPMRFGIPMMIRAALAEFLPLLGGLILLGATASAASASILAYEKDGSIYTADGSDGHHPKLVCRGVDPCVSHDGRLLAFTRSLPGAKKDDAPGTRCIVVRDLANGKETSPPAGGASQTFGALWSADDRWIAFNALLGKSWGVVVLHPDGTGIAP